MGLFDIIQKSDELHIKNNNFQKNIPSESIPHGTEENDDYIDPDDLDYTEYSEIVGTIEYGYDWTLISQGHHAITYLDIDIVFPKPLPIKKDIDSVLLEVTCPHDNIITICGLNECETDMEDFHNNPNLYETPHFLTLRLADNKNDEISDRTIIDISKIMINGKITRLCRELYGDISPVANGKLKKKNDRYYFAKTIILQKGEKMIFKAYRPNVDISKIELFMMSDFFKKDK